MSTFVKHEPCPECRKVGQDASGNNLARYSNGSGFCFSCRFVERPTHYKPKVDKVLTPVPVDLVKHFPTDNLNWLRQYLSDHEIMDHFSYSPSLKRHVYKWADYWEARTLDPFQKKCISHGNKPFRVFGSQGGTLVVVEDVVSAIKVSRVCQALPLFGASIPPDWMVKIAKLQGIRSVKFWLDADKYRDSIEFSRKFNLLAPISRAITTENDPKAYDVDAIKRIIGLC